MSISCVATTGGIEPYRFVDQTSTAGVVEYETSGWPLGVSLPTPDGAADAGEHIGVESQRGVVVEIEISEAVDPGDELEPTTLGVAKVASGTARGKALTSGAASGDIVKAVLY